MVRLFEPLQCLDRRFRAYRRLGSNSKPRTNLGDGSVGVLQHRQIQLDHRKQTENTVSTIASPKAIVRDLVGQLHRLGAGAAPPRLSRSGRRRISLPYTGFQAIRARQAYGAMLDKPEYLTTRGQHCSAMAIDARCYAPRAEHAAGCSKVRLSYIVRYDCLVRTEAVQDAESVDLVAENCERQRRPSSSRGLSPALHRLVSDQRIAR